MTTTIDLGRLRMVYRGSYDQKTLYEKDDIVSFKGSSFIVKKKCKGISPSVDTNEYFDLLAAGTDQLVEKGDMLFHNGNNPVRLPPGKNNQVLQMVDGQPKWQNETIDPSRAVWKLATVNGHGSWHTRCYLMRDGTVKCVGFGGAGTYANGDSKGNNLYVPSRVATRDPDVRFVDLYSAGLAHLP